MEHFFKRNFRFQAYRYEEWQNGRCISRDSIDCRITASVYNDIIRFTISDKRNLRISSSCSFELLGSDILGDRIQYVHSTSDFNPIIPVVCHVFVKNGSVSCVRFAMTNPDRIIEFYGSLIELDQPIQVDEMSREEKIPTAKSIMEELTSYGMNTKEAIMERAVDMYNSHDNVRTIYDARCVIEALKLFVEVNRIEDEECEERTSMLKPKILMFIALCNYKIDNIDQAYHIAHKALVAIDKAEEDSPFVGIPRSMYGEDTIMELIEVIKQNHMDKVDLSKDDEDVNENMVDTSTFESIIANNAPSHLASKDEIKQLIEVITKIQNQFSEIGQRTGDVMIAMKNNQILEMYKNVLYFAWEKYKYGWHSDFWEEGHSMFDYMMFEMKARDVISDMNEVLKQSSPFRMIEKNGAITKALIDICEDLLKKLDSGEIKA